MAQIKKAAATTLTPTASKALIDDFLTPLFTQLIENARRINPHYETLWQDIHDLYQSGGKRLRSYMTLLTFESFSSQSASVILPAAASQELLHTAMLIHDDIIDRDSIRYGVKNISRRYLDYYEELIKDPTDRQHHANSAAILAGDLLISEAYSLITETAVDPADVLTVQRLVAKAIFHVVGGELLDTEAAFRGKTAADPLVIAEEKTSYYSFVTPLVMGATLAKAAPSQQDLLQKLGEQLGIGYQLRDDLLGVFGEQEKTGKSTDGDIKEGKRTFLVEEFLLLANPAQHAEFNTLFGHHNASDTDIARVKSLLIESGAKDAVEQRIAGYSDYSHSLVTMLEIDTTHRKAFSELVDLCLTREK